VDATELQALAAAGESLTVEFKSDRRHEYNDRQLIEAVACLANGSGGVLLLGIEDDGEITGCRPRHGAAIDVYRVQAAIANGTVPPLPARVTVVHVGEKDVLAVEVEEATIPVGTRAGLYTRRALGGDGKPACTPYPVHEMLSRSTSAGQSDYALLEVPGLTWADLDPAEFARFRELVRATGDAALAELSDLEIARAVEVVATGRGEHRPLMGGLLLFGRRGAMRRLAPTHEVSFQVVRGGRVEVNDDVTGGLLASAEDLFRRFTAYNTEEEVDAGLVRLAIPRVPEPALREAVANALVHRDYTMLGQVRVQVADDAVSIVSPGGFPRGVRLDNFLDASRPRSRVLANAFKRAGLVERTGRGIPRMFSSTLRIGRDAPDFSRTSDESVSVVFATAVADAALARFVLERERGLGAPMPLADLQVLHALRSDGRLTLNEAAELTQKSVAETRAALARMVESGLVEMRGGGRGRSYHLSASVYRALGAGSAYVRVRTYDSIQQRQMVLSFVKAHGRVTRGQAAELCALTPTQASALLRRMQKAGDLVLRGERRGSHYVMPGTPPDES
jgi:ATP-dependent DNA helicase RecG